MELISKTKKLIKRIHRRFIYLFVPFYHFIRWKYQVLLKKDYCGVIGGDELIISLTSFPSRINSVNKTIRTLLMQSKKPSRVILWLATDQFKELDLPKNLIELKRYGLDIRWSNDIKSYKKLIPTLKEFPNSTIITVDDDIYYSKYMLAQLYEAYEKNNMYIYCHRTSEFKYDDRFKIITRDIKEKLIPSYTHKLTGCGGVLYPPKCFHKDILNEDIFMNICKTNDDIWFWFMTMLNGYKSVVVKNPKDQLFEVRNTQKSALSIINDGKENLFWKDFNSMLKKYPEASKLIKEDILNN